MRGLSSRCRVEFPAGQTGGVDDLTRLAVAAASGDRVALTAFVRRTQPEVWRLCARLGDRQDADDLTSEVYLRALPALARIRGDASARPWLLPIARPVFPDHVRTRTHSRALVHTPCQLTHPHPPLSPP